MVWQVGGPKGHGAELMINIAIIVHACNTLHRHSWSHFCDEWGGHGPPAPPPVPPPMQSTISNVYSVNLPCKHANPSYTYLEKKLCQINK